MASIVTIQRIERGIILLRGHRVLLDADLAALYGVATKSLNLAVRRNAGRFPADFMFRLTVEEWEGLRFHIATSKKGRGGRRYLPYAFTEQGVAMLSSVLRSKRAMSVNVEIMRTFVRLRQLLASNSELARRLNELEQKYDHQFSIVFDAIRALMAEPDDATDKPRIGYETERARQK